MRRQKVLVGLVILLSCIAVPALAGSEETSPAPPAGTCTAAAALAPMAQPAPASQAPALPFETPWSAALQAACTPSPLCPNSAACNTDCRNRGARLGVCTSDGCCICIWKI